MLLRSTRDWGVFVRARREEQGLTQQQLAAISGVSREWLGRLEAGAPRLHFGRVLDVVTALGYACRLEPGTTETAPLDDVIADAFRTGL